MTSVLEAVDLLSRSPDHRVLTRFVPDPAIYLGQVAHLSADGCKTGLFLDVETTGLDTRRDTIIELGVVPFVFDPADGSIYDAGKGLSYFRDPGRPLDAKITEITGITDEMVAGQSIRHDAVRAMVNDAVLIIAHHAEFDRKFVEREMPFFRETRWACSQIDVPWVDTFGCQAAKLGIILSDACSQFSDGRHRAVEDCHVGVNVLANAVDDSDNPAMAHLLASARQMTNRVWAEGAPFPKKDTLKARGYKWSSKDDGGRNVWYRDVFDDALAEEEMFARDIGGATPRVVRFGSKDRYSTRVD